ncbi:DUF3122 domain-containing protein [Thermosynechococcaceae cyanobacterium BACA0444]|uniref:DUF3122 domain-containing protein n=1 Tax=Pseudocalidococcus azoricus BACA0444 TaxID=2918990 RepID=A0AAE4JYS9_9CYAN|nr:DUF3122 domain-containing protein [Pseudocalidococcus azoricus]MDS3861314.1 DUF3122 domain-containing protein [Pseudocalidococcus azoricus BACA0444]
MLISVCQNLWNFTQRFLVLSLCLGIILCALTSPAQARVQQIEEAPGQIVYQARQTIRDQQNQTWQVIAFQRAKDSQMGHPYLRVVGFPGLTSIDPQLPLIMTNALGDRLIAPPASENLFTDAANPEPHIAQYGLMEIIPKLNIAVPLRLEIPSLEKAVTLNISPSALFEWQNLTKSSRTPPE